MPDILHVHRTGFTPLVGTSGSRNGPYRVNIVFVHGLGGHPRHTWEESATTPGRRDFIKRFFRTKSLPPTAGAQANNASSAASASPKVFWPNDYLANDIPEARIWTYGYNADAFGGLFQANNKNSVSQHGRDLAVRAEQEIMADNEDPVLFVAHNLGDIIVKHAMYRSPACRARLKFIVFLGTPHRGGSYAGWGEIAANLALLALQDTNKKIIRSLAVNGEVLDNIHEEFKTLIYGSDIKVHSFQEARGLSGMRGLHNKVVGDFSSKLDLPPGLETVESIDANHMQMARCNARADPRYRAILGVLKKFLRSEVFVADDTTRTLRRVLLPPLAAAATNTTSLTGADHVCLPCYSLPMPRNHRFIGRDAALDTLKQRLFHDSGGRTVALVGLGGIGKTQVALQLAYWVKDNKPEYSIFWVPAFSQAIFEEAYTEIAKKLGLNKSDQDEDPKSLVRQYLSSGSAGPWLLVVDNADDGTVLFGGPDKPGGVCDYLPESEDGLTLFTTRSKKVAVPVAGSNVVELGEMNSKDATSYLEKSLNRKDLVRSNTEANDLLAELAYLPLAITQAAAYLNENEVSIAEYLELLRGTQQDMVGLMSREFRDKTRYKSSQNAIATTWLVSFDQISKFDSPAADLLSFISFIEPKSIPRSILPGCQSEEQMVRAIGTLCAYAFLSRRGESNVYDMHRLVHMATRVWVNQRGRARQEVRKAIRHVTKVFPSADYKNHTLWKEYLPHSIRVLQEGEWDMKETQELSLWIGRCLQVDRVASQYALASEDQDDRQAKKAVELLEHVVEVKRRMLGADRLDRLGRQDALASYSGLPDEGISV
ncbi:putative kinesin light chain [Chaetomidium leptoderma]|uniref:Kinesin light chain n=1 Tax=Chaetomidium leptoderma TaxID=669021 RepID=A0AAN6VGB8_9PEZI|nr:putative kinesin light chain [Chaetomidium leptoderma]